MLAQKKTSSNCCSAAIAVYLLLFSASYYLHSPSTASGARYRRSACIDVDVLRLVAADCCDVGWISAQHGVLHDRTVSKRPEACINAEGGYFEHLLWHCLPDIPVATHHNRFFSEPPTTTPQLALFRASNVWKNATNLQSDEKVSQLTSQCGDIFRLGGQVDCFRVK